LPIISDLLVVCPLLQRKATSLALCWRSGLSLVVFWLFARSITGKRTALKGITIMVQQPLHLLNTRYQIMRISGAGGYSQVYLADDLLLNRPVALKMLKIRKGDGKREVQRLHQEAQILTRLKHRHIPSFVDLFESQGQWVLAMEYRSGFPAFPTFHEPFPLGHVLARVLDIGRHLAEVLGYLHDHGIIHCDVKPENVLLTPSSEELSLVDFHTCLFASCTTEGLGTFGFSAPEVLFSRGQPITPLADVYSLGILLRLLLTGEHPLEKGQPSGEPVSFSAREALVHQGLLTLLAQMSEVNTEKRPRLGEIGPQLQQFRWMLEHERTMER
jgi:serine/threonine protein kinase